MLSLLAPTPRVRHYVASINWLPYEPLSWVLADAQSSNWVVSEPAVLELGNRATDGRLRDSQIASVTSAAFLAAAGTSPNRDWCRLLENLYAVGRLPEKDWDRYLGLIVKWEIRIKPATELGRSLEMVIHDVVSDFHGDVVINGKWKLDSLTIDDQPQKPSDTYGTFDIARSSWGSASAALVFPKKLKLPVGRHSVKAGFDVVEIASLPSAGATTKPTRPIHFPTQVTAAFTVVPREILDQSTIAAKRSFMTASLSAVARRSKDAVKLTVSSKSVPFQIDATLTLRLPDGRTVPDFERHFVGPSNEPQNWQSDVDDCPPVFDIVLTPDPAASGWPEVLIIPNVRVAQDAELGK